jgi:hypothetical protein
MNFQHEKEARKEQLESNHHENWAMGEKTENNHEVTSTALGK